MKVFDKISEIDDKELALLEDIEDYEGAINKFNVMLKRYQENN
jgi:hypothetical protein